MTSLWQKGAEKIIADRAKSVDALGNVSMEYEIQSFARDVFSTFHKDGASIESWYHLPASSLMQSVGTYSINREELKRLAGQYIEAYPWMHDKQMDWLFANMLTYAELEAFLLHADKTLHFNYSAKARLGAIAVRAAWSLTKWAIWIAVVVAAFMANNLIGMAFVAITIFVQAAQYFRNRRVSRLVVSMMDTYLALSSPTLSWAVVWDLMKKGRDAGAVWDPQLYRLVEMRMLSQAIFPPHNHQ